MVLPSTPAAMTSGSLFGASMAGSNNNGSAATSNHTPSSTASSNNTFLMPNSPLKNRQPADGYRPEVTRTVGQRPACLVNASVTFCGNNQIYAFGGFDQYTDEVYNHVLRLDMISHQWSLVDNYGDIPGVRMGHTATLYQGNKLLVFGGENEHRTHLSDLVIFDLNTAHWTQPAVSGPIPKGRARHAAVLHEDKLFIVGGLTGSVGSDQAHVLDDICYLDLKTYTWSRAWRFVGRYDHTAFIWDDRIWVFGGLTPETHKTESIGWLDLKGSPAFEAPPTVGSLDRHSSSSRSNRPPYLPPPVVGSSGYAANSSSVQVNPVSFGLTPPPQIAPGAISSLRFVSGPNVPSQTSGTHFHVYTSDTMLDFVTPSANIMHHETSLSSLELDALRWHKLADGREFFRPGYRWHYCTMNEEGTKAWLLGCAVDMQDGSGNLGEEYLSDIMEVDLKKFGLLGNNQAPAVQELSRPSRSAANRFNVEPSKGLGSDLSKLFNKPPETGSGTDFTITANREDEDWDDETSSRYTYDSQADQTWLPPDASTSAPIHVHRLILQARWPHFTRLWNAQMAEFHTKKMHIPEPYPVVKAFLYYLYTDSIHPEDGADLSDVAGMLVMSNIYNMPHLRLLCVNRLSKELDVEHACTIWHCANIASEDWLRRRAAQFCLLHWGRVVRTSGFLKLPRSALVELSQEIDMEGRVVGGEELEVVGGLGGGRFGVVGVSRKTSAASDRGQAMDESEADLDDEDDSMEIS